MRDGGIFAATGGASSGSRADRPEEKLADKPPVMVPVDYDPSTVSSLSDGYSAVQVMKVTDRITGQAYVLKQAPLEQNINAVLVSQFLKRVLREPTVRIEKDESTVVELTYHVPEVILTPNREGKLVQQQEYLDGLETRLDNRKRLYGLASFQDLTQMATFGVVYQFLMLGDNMVYNHRFSKGDNSYNIFDFDGAFVLRGRCSTSDFSPFEDRVECVGHAYNDHFMTLLAHRYHKDRYRNVRYNESTVPALNTETWADFFKGVKQGLELIKERISESYIAKDWGAGLPKEAGEHLAAVRTLTLSRLSGVDFHLQYIDDLLKGKRTLCDLDINMPIKASFDAHGSSTREVHAYLDLLKGTMVEEVRSLAVAPAATMKP
ncbi:MAG: hypothetical protein P1U34_01110 [Coxiellaceae bacterium]|nr:hypothetical protein [Coxiellaceae bacterium]